MALDFFAGCVGGCAGLIVGHPFDTIKVRLQTDSAKNPKYKSATHCFVSTIKRESFVGLYKGLSSPMLGVALINATLFGTYGTIQKQFSDQNALSTFFFAGGLAGIIQAAIASPMELVKTLIQIQGQGESVYSTVIGKTPTKKYIGPVDCIMKVCSAKGLRGIFKGLNITIVREFFGFGICFSSYEYFTQKVFTDPNEPESLLTTSQMLLAGGLSGVASWIPTYPIDMLKSRIQVDGFNGPSAYKNSFHAMYLIYKEEGLKAFTKGMSPTLLRAYPVNAVTFAVVTAILQFFGTTTVEEDDKKEALEETITPKTETSCSSENRFIPSLKGIGLLAAHIQLSRINTCATSFNTNFVENLKASANISFKEQQNYNDKVVLLALPEFDVLKAKTDEQSPEPLPKEVVSNPYSKDNLIVNVGTAKDNLKPQDDEQEVVKSAESVEETNIMPLDHRTNDVKSGSTKGDSYLSPEEKETSTGCDKRSASFDTQALAMKGAAALGMSSPKMLINS